MYYHWDSNLKRLNLDEGTLIIEQFKKSDFLFIDIAWTII